MLEDTIVFDQGHNIPYNVNRQQLKFPPLVIGGAGFSYQLHSRPEELPIAHILQKAFQLGLRTIDTSPYYEPSEELLGAALSSPEVTANYGRHDYFLMTKCGRLEASRFDYSPAWIRKSVARSLQRFNTTYLDVVFCHDVEFVSLEQALEALGELFKLKDRGIIHHVGISGYPLHHLILVAKACLQKYQRSIDVVQTWAQLCLQNSRLERSIPAFKAAGVQAVLNASPLACGLLREGGVPVGALGDWHPAPAQLRATASKAAEVMASKGEDLAALSLRYAVARSKQLSCSNFEVATITGVSHVSELIQNVNSVAKILVPGNKPGPTANTADPTSLQTSMKLNSAQLASEEPLYTEVRGVLGDWVDYDFSS